MELIDIQDRVRKILEGGEGSGSWEGPGDPRFAFSGGEPGAAGTKGGAEGGQVSGIGGKGLSGKEWAGSLSKGEHKVIQDWQDADAYKRIRSAQNRGVETAETKAFEEALNKDGSHVGTTYRGLRIDSDKDYEHLITSKTITLNAHASSSQKQAVAQRFARTSGAFVHGVYRMKGHRVILKIEGKSGVDLAAIPSRKWMGEKEVVLKKGTTYRVTKVYRAKGSGRTTITLTED
jgi:hypothetical protein